MARVRKTPPHGVVGYFEVDTKWKLNPAQEYQCTAIRSFAELSLKGIDVYKTYYAPKEVPDSIYQQDYTVGATIVSLQDENGHVFEIPDTFILKYPDIQTEKFKRIILSCDLGALPIGIKVGHVSEVVKTEVEKIYGRPIKVKMAMAPLIASDATPVELKREEMARKTAAQTQETPGGKWMKLKESYANLLHYNKELLKRLNAQSGDKDKEIAKITKERDTEKQQHDILKTKHASLTEDHGNLQAENAKNKAKVDALEKVILNEGLELPY